MKKRILPFVLVTLVAAVCLCAACACSGSDQNVAAKFGDHTISEDEVTSYTSDFRAQNGLSNDAGWVSYLQGNGLTGKTWREQAIRTLAGRELVEDKAKELGITANEDDVENQIAKAKQQAGVAEDDDSAWSDYLSSKGTTPDKYKETCEFTSVEQQVFRKELKFDDQLEAQMCDDYIEQNLADRVVRRYSAIVLKKNKNGKATGEKLLSELKKFSGSALQKRFAELVQADSTDSASKQLDGDIGWDFTYDEASIDPDSAVRSAKLKADELYPELVKGTDAYRIMLCTGVVNFEKTPKFSQLPSESQSTIRGVVVQLTLATNWAGKCQEYLQKLEEDANIQVSEMPGGLPYDLVENDSDSAASTSAATASSSDEQ